jgi:predicted permease
LEYDEYALRNLLIIATLALGIGASTAIFSFIHPLLLHPFAYPEPNRLVMIQQRNLKGIPAIRVSYPAYRDWTTQNKIVPEIAAFGSGFFFLTGVNEPEQVAGAIVTSNAFRTLGVAPALGRDFRDGEEGVVVLSDACWKRRFGADPNILGRTIALDWARTPEVERYTVIGVMPPRFWMYYSGFEVFVPLARSAIPEDRRAKYFTVIGRLGADATVDQAQSALNALTGEKDWTVFVQSWERAASQPLRTELIVLASGAALLLIIAIINVASLLLLRAEWRRREIAIRAALGASRWRIAALFLRESAALAAGAAVCGAMLATWGVRAILAMRPTDLYIMQLSPGLDRIAVDGPALTFAAVSTLIACLAAAVFPALRSRNVDVSDALKDTISIAAQPARKFLVAAEVALSVMLLAGAGLLIKTLQHIRAIDLGYRPDHVLAMRLPIPIGQASDAPRTSAYFREALASRGAPRGAGRRARRKAPR